MANQQTISGTVLNCLNLPVNNGHVIISMPGRTIYANITGGAFTSTFSNCNPGGSASIIAIDDSAQLQSSPVTVSLTTPVVAAGAFSACNASSQEFLTITVNGISRTWSAAPYVLYAFEDSTLNGGFYDINLGAWDTIGQTGANVTLFRAQNAIILPITLGFTEMYINDPLAAPVMLGDYYVDSTFQPPILTQYGAVGQFMVGSFSGRFIKSFQPNVDTVIVSGSFKLRRVQ
jgi:hypothetical protein